ncbi:MAG: serine/threonine protein phosphatase [Blastopirellula sp.]|nr:MAG: serine/threonine protein phosphatase [Blastopirellula sp.]
MKDRVIAIGDIHGCATALRVLIRELKPNPQDTIITLGDYVNRGPDSRGVIDHLIDLQSKCKLIPLLGNHDQMLLSNRANRSQIPGKPIRDQENGLESFNSKHFDFLNSCRKHYEIDSHFFLHANYDAKKSLDDQDDYTMLWSHLDSRLPKRHTSKKIAVVGHTEQQSGEILNQGHLICIDTYCYGDGWLTALDVRSGTLWQANQESEIRQSRL